MPYSPMIQHSLKLQYRFKQGITIVPFEPSKCGTEILLHILQSIHEELQGQEEVVLLLDSISNKRTASSTASKVYLRQFSQESAISNRFFATLKTLKLLAIQVFKKQRCPTTLRDFYYQDVGTFQSQVQSNKYMKVIENSLRLSLRSDFGIHPSQKGLIYGNCQELGLNYSDNPILIPVSEYKEYSNVKLDVIVLEKEAVFRSFCNFLQKCRKNREKNIVVITGKGFPDNLTKRFLSQFKGHETRIFGFMDSDVYGISICKQYASSCNIVYSGVFLLDYTFGWMDITMREVKIILNLLKELPSLKQFPESELHKWHRELTRGILLFKKAEMNLIDNHVSCMSETILTHVTRS